MALTVTSAAASYKLATLADLKTRLGITSSSEDTLLNSLIDQASAQIVAFCNKSFAKETVTETVLSKGGYNLFLTRTPIVSITSITFDGTLIDAANYTLQEPNSGMVYAENGWQCSYGKYSYSVVYVAGYTLSSFGSGTPNLPLEIEAACLDLAKNLYLSKSRDSNISRESVPDVYDVTYGGANGSQASTNGAAAILSALAPLQAHKRFNI